MARGRMLDQGFARSGKLREVSRDARLAYATILPFVDREGRHVAEPFVLKALVFRWSDYSIEEIAACLVELRDADLLRLYADDDNAAILEYVDFAEYNKPNLKEAKSIYPGSDDPNAGLCRDPLLVNAPKPTPEHVQCTGNAPDARTGNAPAMPVENVNGTLTVNDNENGSTSSDSQSELSPPAAVAQARRGKKAKNSVRAIDQPFVDAWNEHRGPLARVISVDKSRAANLDRLRRELGDEALEVFTDAVKQVATERVYVEGGYGFGNLLTGGKVTNWAEKWRSGGGLSNADRRLVAMAQRLSAGRTVN